MNFSNHPSSAWEPEQIEAAERYGKIVDIPFPAVDPRASSEGIKAVGKEYVEIIINCDPEAVMCQGEFTLCYFVITELKKRNVRVLAACSRRMVEETEGGRIVKFRFERFREY